MCDKGILDYHPDAMKLEYCMTIYAEVQQEMLAGISKLIGKPVYIANIKQGQHPYERPEYDRNRIVISTEPTENYKSVVAVFSLSELPGCCGVLVSHHTNIYPQYQGKGINSFLQGIKERIAKDNGYTTLMATVTSDNTTEIHILTKYGWLPRDSFKNKRTGNTVITFTKHIE